MKIKSSDVINEKSLYQKRNERVKEPWTRESIPTDVVKFHLDLDETLMKKINANVILQYTYSNTIAINAFQILFFLKKTDFV